MGGITGFEVFDKRMPLLAKAPSVTIQKRGVISLNKAAHDLINNAETVELLYDRDRNVIALRASDDSSPHAYAVRNGSTVITGNRTKTTALLASDEADESSGEDALVDSQVEGSSETA